MSVGSSSMARREWSYEGDRGGQVAGERRVAAQTGAIVQFSSCPMETLTVMRGVAHRGAHWTDVSRTRHRWAPSVRGSFDLSMRRYSVSERGKLAASQACRNPADQMTHLVGGIVYAGTMRRHSRKPGTPQPITSTGGTDRQCVVCTRTKRRNPAPMPSATRRR